MQTKQTMKEDKLERFIRDNRPAFDTEHPGLGLWNRIEQELPRAATGPTRQRYPLGYPLWRVAAAVLLLLFAGGLIGQQLGKEVVDEQQLAVLEQIAPEFSDLESYYEGRINAHKAQLANYRDDPAIQADLEQIDQAMAELRDELLSAPAGDQQLIVENLINSYRLKLDILERILDRLQSMDPSTPNHDETDEISM